MTTAELNLELEDARKAYYTGEPVMSDAQYDALEAELKGRADREGSTPSVLTSVGSAGPGRIPHAHPMRSIENKYSVEEVLDWAKGMGNALFTLSAKYDGVSCSLTYEKGQLAKAVTRGDGDAGESILDQIKASVGIPSSLPFPVNLEVRGELLMRRSWMMALNKEIEGKGGKPYVSTRNLVAGTIKLKDLEEVAKRRLHFMPWEVLSPLLDVAESGGDSARDRIHDLEGYFEVPWIYMADSLEELRNILTNAAELYLAEKDPEVALDGLVIKVDSCAQRRQLGYGSKFANFQVAYKAQNAKTETVLRQVIWQVGRQGRLTPVGIVDPVVLAGATIERVTLNNLTWIQEMGLQIGSRVTIMRSGDVIPKIVEVLDGDQ